MNGNFTFHNPTRLHFGENAMEFLKDELAAFGPTVMLTYGGGSIKKNGIYDQVVAVLKAAGKTIVEDGGVMPNPTLEKLMDGVAKAKANNVDLILAVGGGSTIDYSKAVSVSTWCEEDPWEKYFVRFEEPSCRIIPVGSVLTMVGTAPPDGVRHLRHHEPHPGAVFQRNGRQYQRLHRRGTDEVAHRFVPRGGEGSERL